MISSGKVRRHILDEPAGGVSFTEIRREEQLYRGFLPSKLARVLYEQPEPLLLSNIH